MVIFGPLTAEIGWRVLGTPANFNRFPVLALLLQRRRSTEANQTLHDVWPSPGLVEYYIDFRRLLPRNVILPGAKFTLPPPIKSCAVLYCCKYDAGIWNSCNGRLTDGWYGDDRRWYQWWCWRWTSICSSTTTRSWRPCSRRCQLPVSLCLDTRSQTYTDLSR